MRKGLFISTLVFIIIFGTACSLPGLGKRVSTDDATATPAPADDAQMQVETAGPGNVEVSISGSLSPDNVTKVVLADGVTAGTPPPTPDVVSLTGEQPAGDTMSLLGGAAPAQGEPDATPALPLPTGEAVKVIRQARYNTDRYSFEPAAGWQMDEIDPDTLLIHLTGDDGPYTGAANRSPYVYFQYTKAISDGTRLVDVLADMRQTLNGVETAEDAAMPIIDGLRGVGQFVEGQNQAGRYRAWLVAFPLRDGALQGVFWGPADTWATTAPQLNAILTTLRFPQL